MRAAAEPWRINSETMRFFAEIRSSLGIFRSILDGRSYTRLRLHHAPHDGGITVTFEVGDKVIYPNQGLGVVTRIEEKTILGTTCGFYHLRIVANETTVLVRSEERRVGKEGDS